MKHKDLFRRHQKGSEDDILGESKGKSDLKIGSVDRTRSFIETIRFLSGKIGSVEDDENETLSSGGSITATTDNDICNVTSASSSDSKSLKVAALERVAMFMCGAFFFLMIANYLLQSVRDSHVIFVGKEVSATLLAASTLCSLIIAPCAKLTVKETTTETAESIQTFYRIFCLILITGVFTPLTDRGDMFTFYFVCFFFVVTQSINNLAISLMWSFSSDLLPVHQSVKYFSMFGASCTLGQAAGSLIASTVLRFGLRVIFILFLVALALECASRSAVLATTISTEEQEMLVRHKLSGQPSEPLHGIGKMNGATDEFFFVARFKRVLSAGREFVYGLFDPYVALIATYTLCYTSSMSLIYLERSSTVSDLGLSLEESSALSARVNFIAACATFAAQVFLSSTSASGYVGTNVGLVALPLVSSIGFALVLAKRADPYMVIASFEVARRVTAFAVVKPVRESLYNVMEREEKFAIKSVIDTFVYKGGMGAGAMLFGWATSETKRDTWAPILMYATLCNIWSVASVALGVMRLKRANETHAAKTQ